jgi:hypothetical protein
LSRKAPSIATRTGYRTTALANLHLTHNVGVHLDKFTDRYGHVDELFDPVL